MSEKQSMIEEWMELLKTDCDNQPFCSLIVNAESAIEQCNERVEQIFKQEREQLMQGGDINVLVPPAVRSKHQDLIKTQFRHNNADLIENVRVGYTKQDREVNISQGLLLKKLELAGMDNTLCMCQVRELEKELDGFLILPENPLQLVWISSMVLFISVTMIQLPYEFVFNRSSDSRWLNQSIQVLTVLDIVFNFNCAYIVRDEVITDRNRIACNQLSGYLVIDFQTGIPTELFDGIINRDVLLVFKLLRSLKLIKYYNALNNEYIQQLLSKNEMFKYFKEFSMNQQFYYEITMLIFGIFIILHQISSFWVLTCQYFTQDSTNWVEQSGVMNNYAQSFEVYHNSTQIYDNLTHTFTKFDRSIHQIADPWDQIQNNPLEAYVAVYFEIASCFFGYKLMQQYNSTELYFAQLIMSLGLLCLAYTIGRVAMLITQSYKDQQTSERMLQVLYAVASEVDLTDNTIDQVLREMKRNQEQMSNKTLSFLRNKIPQTVFNKAQLEQYNTFLGKHKLFKQLPLNTVEVLQRYCKPREGGVLFEANQYATNIFFVISGKVLMIDGNANVIEDFYENEIVGYQEAFSQIRRNVANADAIIASSQPKKKGEKEEDEEVLKKQAKLKQDHFKHEQSAVADNNTQQFMISFALLENLVKDNPEMWWQTQMQELKWRTQISNADVQNTASEMEAYDRKDESAMIFLPSGRLYSVNREFKKIFQKDTAELADCNFLELFELFNALKMPKEMSKLSSGKQYFKIFGKRIEVDLHFNTKTIIVQKDRAQEGKEVLVATKMDATFVYLNITNSIEAFVISKQRAVKDVPHVISLELNVQQREEVEEEEDESKNQQYDMMMKELQEFNVEYKDFRNLLDHRMKNRQNIRRNSKDFKAKAEAVENNNNNQDKDKQKQKPLPKVKSGATLDV